MERRIGSLFPGSEYNIDLTLLVDLDFRVEPMPPVQCLVPRLNALVYELSMLLGLCTTLCIYTFAFAHSEKVGAYTTKALHSA